MWKFYPFERAVAVLLSNMEGDVPSIPYYSGGAGIIHLVDPMGKNIKL